MTGAAVHDHTDHAVKKGCPRCFQIGVGLVTKEGTAMLVGSGLSKQDISVFGVLAQKIHGASNSPYVDSKGGKDAD